VAHSTQPIRFIMLDDRFHSLLINYFLFTQKKERLLKKQQREALLLDSYLTSDGLTTTGRSLRDRKPVTYTFGKLPY
jgi:hypothetical protein